MVSDQGAAYGILTEHKYASTLPEAAAYAVVRRRPAGLSGVGIVLEF